MKPSAGKAVLLLALLGAAAAHAQTPPRPPRPPVPLEPRRAELWAVPRPGGMIAPGIAGVESVLREKEELKLTDQQVAQLEAIRKEEVARRQNESREQIELESRYQAGLVDRDTWRAEMEKRSDTRTAAARSVRDRIEKILTDEQREQLEERRFRRAGIDQRERIERLERERWAPSVRRLPRDEFVPRPPRAPLLERLPEARLRVRPWQDRLREFAPRLDRFRWERRGIL